MLTGAYGGSPRCEPPPGAAARLTHAQDVEAEALRRGLVDQLIGEAVEAHVAGEGQVPKVIALREPEERHLRGLRQRAKLLRGSRAPFQAVPARQSPPCCPSSSSAGERSQSSSPEQRITPRSRCAAPAGCPSTPDTPGTFRGGWGAAPTLRKGGLEQLQGYI